MAYRFDTDLEFLGKLNSEYLNDLVNCITATENIQGENFFANLAKKATQFLTRKRSSLLSSELYKQYYPDHKKYWILIAEEIQRFGANSIVSLFRGGGVKYKKILEDVCMKMNVKYKENLTITAIEEKFLKKLLQDYLKLLKPEELKKMASQLGIEYQDTIKKSTIIKIFLTIFKAGSFEAYRIVITSFNSIFKLMLSKGLVFVTKAVINKKAASFFFGPLAFLSPLFLSIAGIWTAFDIAGPAYRITIPTVVHITMLRKLYEKNKIFYTTNSENYG